MLKSISKSSLRRKLILLFVLASTVPILLLSVYSVYSTRSILRRNTESLVNVNLKQIDDNLNISLDAYDDLLYQIYTSDEVVEWVDKLNAGEDVAVTVSQMRRFLRGLFYTKDYIRSISVLTENGTVITYDMLSATTYDNSWMDNFSISEQELMEYVINEQGTCVFDTEYATSFANEDYYLFHMAHRIIDYKKLTKRSGIVVMSLDERFLQSIMEQEENDSDESNCYIVGKQGQIISFPSQNHIGEVIADINGDFSGRLATYKSSRELNRAVLPAYTDLYGFHDDDLGWDIVYLVDQHRLMNEMNIRGWVSVAVCVILLVITLIALKDVLVKERESNDIKRRAEITALEAQINPHFLYNTLDTINWMAIDKDEFDISNAINTLATILRYAITNSNGTVTVEDETEWLKKYIYLQQVRLKNKFTSYINVDPTVREVKVHKLLLQPFVENAIIHGFRGAQDEYILKVSIEGMEDGLAISISDNGVGMDEQTVERLNMGMSVESDNKNHIGIENAITRIRMYYGENSNVEVSSKEGEGTTILMKIVTS